MTLPMVSALLAFVVALFRSRRSMQLEILALRHQLAVYQRSVPKPPIQPADRLLWAWLAVSGRAGGTHSPLSSLAQSLCGNGGGSVKAVNPAGPRLPKKSVS